MKPTMNVIPLTRGKGLHRRRGRSNCRLVPKSEQMLIPVLTWSQAARWEALIEDFEPEDNQLILPIRRGHSPATFGLMVEDLAMASDAGKRYVPGDVIVVDPAEASQVKTIKQPEVCKLLV